MLPRSLDSVGNRNFHGIAMPTVARPKHEQFTALHPSKKRAVKLDESDGQSIFVWLNGERIYPSVLFINSVGFMKAKKKGTAVITVTLSSGVSFTRNVRVE